MPGLKDPLYVEMYKWYLHVSPSPRVGMGVSVGVEVGVGCEVLTYRGEELSLKAEGGATCLTRPVLRASF